MDTDSEWGALMPKIRSYHHRDHFEHAGASGGMIDSWISFCRGRIFDKEADTGQYEEPMEVFWASGAALCIRPALYKRLKGFDEELLRTYGRDRSLLAFETAGYKISVIPSSVVFHVGGGSLKKRIHERSISTSAIHSACSTRTLIFWSWWKLPLRMLVLDVIALLKSLMEGKWREAWAIIRADWYFF